MAGTVVFPASISSLLCGNIHDIVGHHRRDDSHIRLDRTDWAANTEEAVTLGFAIV